MVNNFVILVYYNTFKKRSQIQTYLHKLFLNAFFAIRVFCDILLMHHAKFNQNNVYVQNCQFL